MKKSNHIAIFEDVLPEEICKEIIETTRYSDYSKFQLRYRKDTGLKEYCLPKEMDSLLKVVTRECLRDYLKDYNLEVDKEFVYVSTDILSQDRGGFSESHFDDAHLGENTMGYTRDLTVLLYLSSVEQGGELLFNEQGFTVKPEAGKVVIFPASITHPHLTLPCDEERYVAIVKWVRGGKRLRHGN